MHEIDIEPNIHTSKGGGREKSVVIREQSVPSREKPSDSSLK